MLGKRRETLELQTELAATTAKINYLKDAEMLMLSPVRPFATPVQKPMGAEATKAIEPFGMPESLLYPCAQTSPVVRTRPGVQFLQFPLHKSAPDDHLSHTEPKVHSSSDTQPQLQQTSAHSISPSLASQTQTTRSTLSQIPSTSNSMQESHVIKILENQTELTKTLAKQQLLSTLPKGNIPLFDGQILEYRSFIHSFI